jgi:hypothetical protein
MIRACYRCVLWLHPPVFRRQFAGEMLWIFDQAAESQGALSFLSDALGSLARQWLLRSGWWKIAAALVLALFQVVFGGFGMVLFERRRMAGLAVDPPVNGIVEFSRHGAIAHQPLTVGIVMFLAVLVTGGLVMMVLGLTWWLKIFGTRRRAVINRVR